MGFDWRAGRDYYPVGWQDLICPEGLSLSSVHWVIRAQYVVRGAPLSLLRWTTWRTGWRHVSRLIRLAMISLIHFWLIISDSTVKTPKHWMYLYVTNSHSYLIDVQYLHAELTRHLVVAWLDVKASPFRVTVVWVIFCS